MTPGGAAARGARWRLSRAGIVAVAVLLAACYGAVWVGVVSGSALVDLDLAVLRSRPAERWPDLGPLVSALVLLGQRAVLLGVLAVWLLARFRRDRDVRPLLWAAVATVALNVVVGAAKMVGDRLGPLQLGAGAVRAGAAEVFREGMAFPSGHAANAVLVWGLLVLLARRRRRLGAVLAVLLALVVGASTVYLGTHWVSDVVAGWALGALVLLALPLARPLVDALARRIPAAGRVRGWPGRPLVTGVRTPLAGRSGAGEDPGMTPQRAPARPVQPGNEQGRAA